MREVRSRLRRLLTIRAREGGHELDQKNSPSRFRFRPPFRPTFGFRLRPPGWASTYSRSVLGASGTLELSRPPCKTCPNVSSAICKKFSFQHFPHQSSASVDKSGEDATGSWSKVAYGSPVMRSV